MLNFSNIFRSVICLRHTVLAFIRLYLYNHTIPYIPPRSYSSHLVIVLVRVVTVNAAVLRELGRFPLSMFARERCLKYWYTIIFNRYTTVLAMQYFQNSVTVCYVNSFHNDLMFKLWIWKLSILHNKYYPTNNTNTIRTSSHSLAIEQGRIQGMSHLCHNSNF